ncbi:hypothetical protein L6452_30120 [Arctium lappa]|uniref:Uncharacterized protein n=1 Tax=Arctium lappa TaxID=4217 RepID=A0ACB8ZH08_ARCLA|nr:hypothetical protein L6452_30120 [Arctium lappa]
MAIGQIGSQIWSSFVLGSVLQHHDSGSIGQTGRSHWWARGGDGGGGGGGESRAVGPQTSFLEPPKFIHNDYDGHHDNFSNRSFEEEEDEEEDQRFDWRASNRLSKTFFMDDVEGGGKFDLPFDDIYDRHSESPPPRTRLGLARTRISQDWAKIVGFKHNPEASSTALR